MHDFDPFEWDDERLAQLPEVHTTRDADRSDDEDWIDLGEPTADLSIYLSIMNTTRWRNG